MDFEVSQNDIQQINLVQEHHSSLTGSVNSCVTAMNDLLKQVLEYQQAADRIHSYCKDTKKAKTKGAELQRKIHQQASDFDEQTFTMLGQHFSAFEKAGEDISWKLVTLQELVLSWRHKVDSVNDELQRMKAEMENFVLQEPYDEAGKDLNEYETQYATILSILDPRSQSSAGLSKTTPKKQRPLPQQQGAHQTSISAFLSSHETATGTAHHSSRSLPLSFYAADKRIQEQGLNDDYDLDSPQNFGDDNEGASSLLRSIAAPTSSASKGSRYLRKSLQLDLHHTSHRGDGVTLSQEDDLSQQEAHFLCDTIPASDSPHAPTKATAKPPPEIPAGRLEGSTSRKLYRNSGPTVSSVGSSSTAQHLLTTTTGTPNGHGEERTHHHHSLERDEADRVYAGRSSARLIPTQQRDRERRQAVQGEEEAEAESEIEEAEYGEGMDDKKDWRVQSTGLDESSEAASPIDDEERYYSPQSGLKENSDSDYTEANRAKKGNTSKRKTSSRVPKSLERRRKRKKLADEAELGEEAVSAETRPKKVTPPAAKPKLPAGTTVVTTKVVATQAAAASLSRAKEVVDLT